MSVQKTKDGNYQVNIYLGVGEPRYRKNFETRDEAEIHEMEIQLKLRKGEAVLPAKKANKTFEDVYVEWWNKKYTKTTANAQITYEDTHRFFKLHILPHLGKLEVKAINLDVLEDLQNLWAFGDDEKGLSPQANFKKYIYYTNMVIRYAVVKGYMKKNPFDQLDKPVNPELERAKAARNEGKYYPGDLINQTLKGMRELFGTQAYLLLHLINGMGATKGEIYPLVWKDIDFKTGIVDLSHRLEKDSQSGKMMRVRGMKNKYRFRYLQLNESLLKELRQWKQEQKVLLAKMNIEQRENQFLFSFTSPKHGVNQPLERDWLNRKLRKVEQVYNLPHMTPHGFRHTFISDSLNAGVNQFSLKGIVGHSPVSNVTEHTYGHVNAQAQKSVFETVEAARRNGTLMVHSGQKEKHSPSKTSA